MIVHKALVSPLPIPFFRTYRIPDVLRFVGLLAFNILFSVQKNEYSTDYTLYGWLAIANAGLALLFATRSNLFSIVLRLPSPVVLQYHRWIGVATVAHATTHMAYTIQRYIATDQVTVSFTSRRIQVGLMSWISLVLMFLTALPIVRRRLFEVFYYTHFLFLVFIGGAFYHSTSGAYATKGIEFLTVGLCLWAVDRIVRFLYNFRTIRLEKTTYYSGDLVKIKCTGVRAAQPGQIVWIQLPSISFVNWHPFTVASVSQDARPTTTIAVRGLGAYTTAVQKLPGADKDLQSDIKDIRLRIDGPYGVGRFNWAKTKLAILVAGGVGITPGLSIASYIIQNGAREQGGTQSIHLLWVIKDLSHVAWFEDELRELHERASQANSATNFNVSIHVSQIGPPAQGEASVGSLETTKNSNEASLQTVNPWKISDGRPDLVAWMQGIQSEYPGQDGSVNICGPRSLISTARRACAKTSSRDGLLFVEEEVFEL